MKDDEISVVSNLLETCKSGDADNTFFFDAIGQSGCFSGCCDEQKEIASMCILHNLCNCHITDYECMCVGHSFGFMTAKTSGFVTVFVLESNMLGKYVFVFHHDYLSSVQIFLPILDFVKKCISVLCFAGKTDVVLENKLY